MAMRHVLACALALIGAFALAGCQESSLPKDLRPVPAKLLETMDRLQMKKNAPILIRLFKEDSKLEVWKEKTDGQYGLLKTYSICKWSGNLGPKIKEGDRQAPEGFYTVTPAQMNPKSLYYLSFNIGYPNAFDRSLGRTGSNLMVHGACSSSGCYSMTDADAGELFALARDAFLGGQREFQIEAFPFRMTPENMARHRDDPNMPFWQMLKIGYDHFEVTRQVPKVDVCNKMYVFDADSGGKPFVAAAACPAYTVPETIATAVSAKQAADDQKFKVAVAELEKKEARAAEVKQKAEEKAALEAQREAERAAHPSLIARVLGVKPVAAGETAEAGSSRPAPGDGAAAPQADAAPTPLPRLKPTLASDEVASVEPAKPKPPAKKPAPKPLPPVMDAPPVAKAAPAPQPVAVAAQPAAAPPPAPSASGDGAEPQTVGTFVKRKFLWPDDEAAPASN